MCPCSLHWIEINVILESNENQIIFIVSWLLLTERVLLFHHQCKLFLKNNNLTNKYNTLFNGECTKNNTTNFDDPEGKIPAA